MANKLDAILESYVADGDTTKGKLLGVAFVVVSKDGTVTVIVNFLLIMLLFFFFSCDLHNHPNIQP